MSNPWPHRSRRFDPERGQYVAVTGDSVADDVAVTWSSALAEAGHSLDEIDACAARVRDGARAACKRLRGERDAARQFFAEERETALEIRADLTTARLELRALEWLVKGGHQHWIAYDNVTRIVHGHTGPDWQTVARALGWEG